MDEIRKSINLGLEARGISAAALSRKLDRNHAYISQFLSGKQRSLPFEERVFIADFLGLDPVMLGIAPTVRPSIANNLGLGFSEDAVQFVPPSGHFLSTTPSNYLLLKQVSNSLDQHSEPIEKGDVVVFDLDKCDPATIKPLTVVAIQMCDRKELIRSHGSLTRLFMPPNKLLTNSSTLNEIVAMDDPLLPYFPVIKGSFYSVIRGLHID